MDNIQDKILTYSYISLDIEKYIQRFEMTRLAYIKSVKESFPLSTNSSISSYRDVVCKINKIISNSFTTYPLTGYEETFSLLLPLFQNLKEYKFLDKSDMQTLFAFQKKIDIFHRIFEYYDDKMRKHGASYKNIRNYSLFSIILMMYHYYYTDYSVLNTAFKINDLIIKSDWVSSDVENKLVIYTILLEQIIIKKEKNID